MKTPLKYWKTDGSDDTTSRPQHAWNTRSMTTRANGAHGDGLIVVDEGFIRMTSTDLTKIRLNSAYGYAPERLSAFATRR